MTPKRKSEKSRVSFVDDLGFYSEERNLYILSIAKNCTSSMLANLKDDFVSGTHPRKDADVIVILRDPYKRWISGTVEFFALTQDLHRYRPVEYMLPALDRWLRFPPVVFDYHTEPQSVTLNTELPEFTGRVFYYYQDSKVLDAINTQWNILNKVEHLNTAKHSIRPKFVKAINKWAKQNHDKLVEHINNLYAEDYKIINKSRFVDWPVACSIL
jgi:hypothetical protein